jgi:hypothetical protein
MAESRPGGKVIMCNKVGEQRYRRTLHHLRSQDRVLIDKMLDPDVGARLIVDVLGVPDAKTLANAMLAEIKQRKALRKVKA